MHALLLALMCVPCQMQPQDETPKYQDQYPWTTPAYETQPSPTPSTTRYEYQPEPAPSAPGVYPYDAGRNVRNIDGLPRSSYPKRPDEEGWDLTEADREPDVALHMKTTFRAGAGGMERLCVIEAQGRREDAHRAAVVLRDRNGRELWRRSAAWLGPGGRFRAFWLPVRLKRAEEAAAKAEPVASASALSWDESLRMWRARSGDEPGDTLELCIGGEMKAWCRADLGKWAPKVVVEVRSLGEPNAIDQGWGLMPARQLLASRQGKLEILAGTPEGLDEPVRVVAKARRAVAGGPFSDVLRERVGASERAQTGRWIVGCEGLTPGVYELVVSANVGGEEEAERSYRLHILGAVRTPQEFGARYASLAYDGPVYMNYAETMPWERVWRGHKQRDVVVEWPGKPFRFVLWRGASYVPCWAFQNTWLTYEWLEAEPDYAGAVDCVEPIMDKYCRYSDAEILESNPARAVIHWRYALTDFHQKIIKDEWADEYFYLYPDAIGTRKLVGWIRGYGWHENQEFIVLNRAGNRPWQAIEPQAVTFLSTDGVKQRPYWPDPRFSVDGWDDIIARANIRNQPDPFMAVPADYGTYVKVWAEPYANKPGLLNAYLHWPITHGIWTTWVDRDEQFERPTHSNLVNIVTDEAESAEDHKTWEWLIGIAPAEERLIQVSACWLRPGDVEVTAGDLTYEGYDSSQRAYALKGKAGPVALVLRPPDGAPVINPAFVIDGWAGGIDVRVSGGAASRVKAGSEDEGRRAVVFMEGVFDEPTRVRLRPARR